VGGIISFNPVLSLASHEESNSEDKKSGSNMIRLRLTDESNHLSNERKMISTGDSTTDVPTVGNVVIPLQETVVQQQNTVTPQVIQAVHTEYLENSLNTISTQDKAIKDTTLLIQLINSAQ
jgi:hypothetical protein